MNRNILIISNDSAEYHFSVNRELCFELIFYSEKELSIPTNSPEMAVLKSFAYSQKNSKDKLRTVAVSRMVRRLYDRYLLLPIVDIHVKYHNVEAPDEFFDNYATVHFIFRKPDKTITNDFFLLKYMIKNIPGSFDQFDLSDNGAWIIFDWAEIEGDLTIENNSDNK